MRARLQASSNHCDNFSTTFALRKISYNRMSLLNNRFSKFQNQRSKKHTDKRVSLITGKQMTVGHTTKRSRNYRRVQLIIYNFLERPVGGYAASYQVFIFATVFLCLILSVLATIQQYEDVASSILMHTEIVIVFWLSIELSLRVWSAGCRSRYQTWKGRLKFMKNIFCILDLTVIIASISLTVIASSQNKHKNFAAAAFRGLRFFQILRMLRVDRRAGTWRLLGTVVWAHRQELITTFYIGFLSLIVSSFIMYTIEKDDPGSNIKTFADSLWWGVITLCTIGYGDVVPVTWGGKLLASSCALIGISFFALPAGILGSGFALKVQSMQRQKHLNRRRAPAATLIQCLWRCYAADPNSMSVATWKVPSKAIANAVSHPPLISSLSNPPVIPEYSIANIARPYIGPNSFLNRVTSLKRRTPPPSQPTTSSSEHHKINENKSYVKTNSLVQLPVHLSSSPEMIVTSLHSRRDAIVIPSLFNAQTSVYTYNNMNNSCPSPDTLLLTDGSDSPPPLNSSYILALQQVNKNINNQDSSKITPVKSSLAHRTLNFLTDFNTSNLLQKQADHEEAGLNEHGQSGSGHSSKPQLTNQHKNAIRALRKIKYFVARRKFREALRPYDVTDVIEQYSAGNLDMLARIKTLQFRLDKILGSTKSKECYDSNTTSLASRILKVERQMDDVSLKLDKFFTSYTLDMKLLMEKTTENCILNENLLKYSDTPIKKEDIIPAVITPSMIYHKKSVICDGYSTFEPKHKAHNKVAAPSSKLIETENENLKLIKLKEEKAQLDEKIRQTMENLSQQKAKCQFLLGNSDIDYMGSYEYEDNNSKNCLKTAAPTQTIQVRRREKSRSDGIIRFVDRRKRINKFFMKKYFLNAIKYKINMTCLKDFRLKKFKSDNDVWFSDEFVKHPLIAMDRQDFSTTNNYYGNSTIKDLLSINKLTLESKLDADFEEILLLNQEKMLGLEENRDSKVNASPYYESASIDPSLASTCLIDILDEKDDELRETKISSINKTTDTSFQQKKPPKLKPQTTGYFSNLDLELPSRSATKDENADMTSKSENDLEKK